MNIKTLRPHRPKMSSIPRDESLGGTKPGSMELQPIADLASILWSALAGVSTLKSLEYL
jgi:hypothetical protein